MKAELLAHINNRFPDVTAEPIYDAGRPRYPGKLFLSAKLSDSGRVPGN